MLAQYSLSQAQKRVQEAREHRAEEFTPAELDAALAQINDAQSKLNTQSYPEARQTASTASATAKTLLSNVIQRHAEDLQKLASVWLSRAAINEAQQINQTRLQEIQAANDQGIDQFGKQKYEAAIETFQSVVDNVQSLLAPLRTQAEQGLAETRQMREELVTEGSPEFAPEFIETIDRQIADLERYLNQEYNYRAALSTLAEARQTRQEGIKETKRVKSERLINEIDNLMATALNLDAELYAQQTLRGVTREHEGLLRQYYDQKYDTVLQQGETLRQQADGLILETKREAARSQMEAVESGINMLSDNKAREYLQGRVEQLDTMLAEARGMFEQEQFVESREVSERALEVRDTIVQEFDALAQQRINAASEAVGAAEGVFGKMEQIFDKPVPGDWSGDDLALENAKQALKEELRARLSNAQLSLGLATMRREEKDFDMAIEIAGQVVASAEEVVGQTYRVVAHNAVLEIANEATRYEREGARQWVEAELDKTRTMLDTARQLLRDGQFRDAVRQTAETKAQLEVMASELQRVANEQIQGAESQLAKAREKRGEQYMAENLAQADVMLQRAREAMQGEGLRAAIESAEAAGQIAEEAAQEAMRQWAGDLARETEIVLDRAVAAGANRFSPDQVQSARNLRQELQGLVEAKEYERAVEVGAQAADTADAALHAEIRQAEDAIAEARRYNAWQHEPDRLTRAVVALKDAREQLEAGQYEQATLNAQQAIVSAGNATKQAKHEGYSVQMDALGRRLAAAQESGTGYYQVKEVAAIVAEMSRLRAEFDPEKYEDYALQVEALEGQLAQVMERTPQVLDELVAMMTQRLGVLESQNAASIAPEQVEKVRRSLNLGQIDFKGQKFLSSFQNAKEAGRALHAIDVAMAEAEFDATMTAYLTEFSDAMRGFAGVLDMGSTVMIRLAIDPTGRAQAVAMLNASSPSDLRSQINDMGARVQAMETPPSRRHIKAAMIEMLAVARNSASNFERLLILDQYSTTDARDFIQKAYLQMYNARSRQRDIQAAINPRIDNRPAGVARVARNED